jgi:hypothetical protein
MEPPYQTGQKQLAARLNLTTAHLVLLFVGVLDAHYQANLVEPHSPVTRLSCNVTSRLDSSINSQRHYGNRKLGPLI